MFTDPGTAAETRKQISKMARDAFKDHIITREADNLWLCHRPGTGMYAFRLAALPGALVFYGDIGEAILRPSDRDVLPWLRGAARSFDYVIEKVHPRPEQTFYSGDAIEWARSECLVSVEEEARRQANWGELDQRRWAEIINEHGADSEFCTIGIGASAAMCWMVEALRWFVEHEAKEGK
jgi:hypothetical protein